MENISLLGSFLKMIFALAVVLGLLIGVMYFIKIFMQRTASPGRSDALINIVSSRYLGPKTSIILVEVLDRLIVVGLSAQQMTTLAEIDDPLSVARIKASSDGSSGEPVSEGMIAKYLSLINLSPPRKTDGSKR